MKPTATKFFSLFVLLLVIGAEVQAASTTIRLAKLERALSNKAASHKKQEHKGQKQTRLAKTHHHAKTNSTKIWRFNKAQTSTHTKEFIMLAALTVSLVSTIVSYAANYAAEQFAKQTEKIQSETLDLSLDTLNNMDEMRKAQCLFYKQTLYFTNIYFIGTDLRITLFNDVTLTQLKLSINDINKQIKVSKQQTITRMLNRYVKDYVEFSKQMNDLKNQIYQTIDLKMQVSCSFSNNEAFQELNTLANNEVSRLNDQLGKVKTDFSGKQYASMRDLYMYSTDPAVQKKREETKDRKIEGDNLKQLEAGWERLEKDLPEEAKDTEGIMGKVDALEEKWENAKDTVSNVKDGGSELLDMASGIATESGVWQKLGNLDDKITTFQAKATQLYNDKAAKPLEKFSTMVGYIDVVFALKDGVTDMVDGVKEVFGGQQKYSMILGSIKFIQAILVKLAPVFKAFGYDLEENGKVQVITRALDFLQKIFTILQLNIQLSKQLSVQDKATVQKQIDDTKAELWDLVFQVGKDVAWFLAGEVITKLLGAVGMAVVDAIKKSYQAIQDVLKAVSAYKEMKKAETYKNNLNQKYKELTIQMKNSLVFDRCQFSANLMKQVSHYDFGMDQLLKMQNQISSTSQTAGATKLNPTDIPAAKGALLSSIEKLCGTNAQLCAQSFDLNKISGAIITDAKQQEEFNQQMREKILLFQKLGPISDIQATTSRQEAEQYLRMGYYSVGYFKERRLRQNKDVAYNNQVAAEGREPQILLACRSCSKRAVIDTKIVISNDITDPEIQTLVKAAQAQGQQTSISFFYDEYVDDNSYARKAFTKIYILVFSKPYDAADFAKLDKSVFRVVDFALGRLNIPNVTGDVPIIKNGVQQDFPFTDVAKQTQRAVELSSFKYFLVCSQEQAGFTKYRKVQQTIYYITDNNKPVNGCNLIEVNLAKKFIHAIVVPKEVTAKLSASNDLFVSIGYKKLSVTNVHDLYVRELFVQTTVSDVAKTSANPLYDHLYGNTCTQGKCQFADDSLRTFYKSNGNPQLATGIEAQDTAINTGDLTYYYFPTIVDRSKFNLVSSNTRDWDDQIFYTQKDQPYLSVENTVYQMHAKSQYYYILNESDSGYTNYYQGYFNGLVPLLRSPIGDKHLWVKPSFESGYVPLVVKAGTYYGQGSRSPIRGRNDKCISTFWRFTGAESYRFPQPFWNNEERSNNQLLNQQMLLGQFYKKAGQYVYLLTLSEARNNNYFGSNFATAGQIERQAGDRVFDLRQVCRNEKPGLWIVFLPLRLEDPANILTWAYGEEGNKRNFKLKEVPRASDQLPIQNNYYVEIVMFEYEIQDSQATEKDDGRYNYEILKKYNYRSLYVDVKQEMKVMSRWNENDDPNEKGILNDNVARLYQNNQLANDRTPWWSQWGYDFPTLPIGFRVWLRDDPRLTKRQTEVCMKEAAKIIEVVDCSRKIWEENITKLRFHKAKVHHGPAIGSHAMIAARMKRKNLKNKHQKKLHNEKF